MLNCRLTWLVLPVFAGLLCGCPPQQQTTPPETPSSGEATGTGTSGTTPKEEPAEPAPEDDAESVQALADAGVQFVKNDNGNVVAADCVNATITDEQLDLFKGLPELERLSLENTQITSDGLAILEHLPPLVELSLRRCTHVDASGLEKLKYQPDLQRLLLLYTRTTNEGLKYVEPLKKLRLLDLRGCMQIGDAGLASLSGLTELVELKLRSYGVTDAGMKHLSGLTKLRHLAMEDCAISNAGMEALAPLDNLKILNVMRTTVGDQGLANFSDNKFQDLRLRDTACTGAGLDDLHASIPTLTYLDLSETLITNEGVGHIAPFVNLKTLSIWNGRVDDEGLTQLTDLNELESLDVKGCRSLTSASADTLMQLPKLATLDIAETGIDDEGFKKLGDHPALKTINVGRSRISDTAIEEFRSNHPNIKVNN